MADETDGVVGSGKTASQNTSPAAAPNSQKMVLGPAPQPPMPQPEQAPQQVAKSDNNEQSQQQQPPKKKEKKKDDMPDIHLDGQAAVHMHMLLKTYEEFKEVRESIGNKIEAFWDKVTQNSSAAQSSPDVKKPAENATNPASSAASQPSSSDGPSMGPMTNGGSATNLEKGSNIPQEAFPSTDSSTSPAPPQSPADSKINVETVETAAKLSTGV